MQLEDNLLYFEQLPRQARRIHMMNLMISNNYHQSTYHSSSPNVQVLPRSHVLPLRLHLSLSQSLQVPHKFSANKNVSRLPQTNKTDNVPVKYSNQSIKTIEKEKRHAQSYVLDFTIPITETPLSLIKVTRRS